MSSRSSLVLSLTFSSPSNSTVVRDLLADCCIASCHAFAMTIQKRTVTTMAITAAFIIDLLASRVPTLHLCQQSLDLVILFHRDEAVFYVVGADFGFRLAHGFVVRDLALHAIEGG